MEPQPLSSEPRRQRLRSRIVEEPLHLSIEGGGRAQRALSCDAQQFIVRSRAPDEIRQARCEIEIADAVGRTRRAALRLALEAEQEFRTHENAAERKLETGVELRGAALLRAVAKPGQRNLQILVADRPAVGAARKRRDDFPGARRLVGRRCRPAHEDAAPAG